MYNFHFVLFLLSTTFALVCFFSSVVQDCGADCAKFQKSEIEHRFTKHALERPYTSPHAWGPTYGAHKQHLEFSHQQYRELQQFANDIGIFFTASGMDEVKYVLREIDLKSRLTGRLFELNMIICAHKHKFINIQ